MVDDNISDVNVQQLLLLLLQCSDFVRALTENNTQTASDGKFE